MTKDQISKWIHMAWDFTKESEENLKRKFEYQEASYMPYEKFAKLVAEHEREACAKVVEADGLARGNEGLVLIKAAGRIRARGVDAVNMTQDRVDETAKGGHNGEEP